MKIGIGEAAKELGVSISTLRRWESEGKITSERTHGKHRRYDISTMRNHGESKPVGAHRITIAYARGSSHDQKSDLVRQVERLETYCAAKGWRYEIVSDLGSGLNYNKRGLRKLILRICEGEVSRLVITHKDRLLRFGSELVFAICEKYGTEVVILNASDEMTFEQELAEDVLEIITVFSARLYGSRSHKNKKIMKSLKEVGDAICS
jgi:excisionase family DNA binding protein